MKSSIKFNLSLILIAAFSFAGCGGGGGFAPVSSTSTATTTGVFLDSPVSGLNYTCSSGATGLTNSAGEYTCPVGDNVTFAIGSLNLGTVPVSSVVTPYDLFTTNATAMENILQILQTLDSDNDPSNGIEITEALRIKFAGYTGTIDADDFDSVASTLVGKALVSPKKALEHFNQTLKQSGKKNIGFQLSSIGLDIDGDGTIDGSSSLTYDDNGNILTISITVEGFTFTIGSFTYDAKGNVLTANTDFNLNGTLDLTGSFTYDDKGNILTEDYSNAGSITYTYDENGNMLTKTANAPGGGSIYIMTYTYDSNGNQLTYSVDSDADGTVEGIQIYTYDENGNQLTHSYDRDGDGPEAVVLHSKNTYDVNGNKLTMTQDTNFDGTDDSFTTYAYTFDSNGNKLTESTHSEYGDTLVTYTYDANGNMLTESTDYFGDGTVDMITTLEYKFAPLPDSKEIETQKTSLLATLFKILNPK